MISSHFPKRRPSIAAERTVNNEYGEIQIQRKKTQSLLKKRVMPYKKRVKTQKSHGVHICVQNPRKD
jgi:hypothetical protein